MAKYKFHIDKGNVPDEKVKQHKDFKKLLYNYQRATRPITKVPLYKVRNKRLFLAILLILLVVFLLFSESIFEENGKRTKSVNKYEHTRIVTTHQNIDNKTGG